MKRAYSCGDCGRITLTNETDSVCKQKRRQWWYKDGEFDICCGSLTPYRMIMPSGKCYYCPKCKIVTDFPVAFGFGWNIVIEAHCRRCNGPMHLEDHKQTCAMLDAEFQKPIEEGMRKLAFAVDKLGEKAEDEVVERNRAALLERSKVGIKKYGTPMDKAGLSLKQWLQHALEESLDQCNYLQAAIMEIEKNEKLSHVSGLANS